jgi:hypothetical protein
MERAGKLLRKSGLLSPEEMLRTAWPQAVGRAIARNSRVVAVRGKRIVVEVPDALFQENLRGFVPVILRRLAQVAGAGVVESITVNIGVPRIEPRRAARYDEADTIEDAGLRRVYRDSRNRLTS